MATKALRMSRNPNSADTQDQDYQMALQELQAIYSKFPVKQILVPREQSPEIGCSTLAVGQMFHKETQTPLISLCNKHIQLQSLIFNDTQSYYTSIQ